MFQKTGDGQGYAHHDMHEDEVETVVGPSVHVEGDFASEGNIIVKGMVSGAVKTSRQLTVVEGARIMANVKAGSALISGHIKGNIKAEDRIELTETAQVLGDISCAVLAIAPGALVQGKVNMQGIAVDDEDKPKRRTTKKREEPVEAEDVMDEEMA